MRFLLITSDFPYPSDPTRGVFNLHLVRALVQEHEVRVIAPRTWIEAASSRRARVNVLQSDARAQLAGIEVQYPTYYYTPKLFRFAYGSFLWHSIKVAIRRVLQSFSPDAVIAYWAHPDGEVAVRLGKIIGVPSIVIVGGSDVLLLPNDPRRRVQIQKVLQEAHGVVAVSRHLKNKIVDLGTAEAKVHVWHQGVDEQLFFPSSREEARRRLGIPLTGNKLLWVGRMVPVKGLEVLFQACANLRDRGRDFHLYLAGDGPLRQRLESQVSAQVLADSITFNGPIRQEQLADWYRAVDATVMASYSEGIPNVLRESMACGTPFVATRVGGIPELANGQVDRLVPPGDPVALADAIEHLFAQTEPAASHSKLPTWKEAAESFVKIVQPLVSASQNPDQPWWIVEGSPSAQTPAPGGPKRWKQLARKILAIGLPFNRIIFRGPAASRSVCLTFDDGPHPKHTSDLLDVLAAHGIKATFFVIGRLVEKYPQIVRRMQQEGHLVANHSFYHPNPKLTPTSFLLNGIDRTDNLLAQMVGNKDSFYRPPHGKLTSWTLLRLWLAKRKIVLWNIDPKDYACQSSEELLAWFQKHPMAGGDVVLLHDRLPYANSVIPHLVKAAKEQGLHFATIDQCLN
jgi:glycosyltransferase involved in cell wall biosynthesis/peptidoglycan/xylan/chitin deacetylase (PgdA/CDA1 family)